MRMGDTYSGYWMLDAGYWILDTRYWMLDVDLVCSHLVSSIQYLVSSSIRNYIIFENYGRQQTEHPFFRNSRTMHHPF
jgi:hypothetical protein